MWDFEDKVVLVTGAGRGIGKAVATAFAGRGAAVAVNDIAPDSAERAAAGLRAEGWRAQAFVADVSKKMQVQSMIEAVREAFDHIDVLVNSAVVEPRADLLTMDEWDWDRTLAVNLKGPFLTTQSVARVMADEGGGAVVNVASHTGRAHGLPQRAAYVASKMGLIGLTREAARELAGYGVRVNAVCPGKTDGHAAQLDVRQERPQGVAAVVLFLSSDAARHMTGQAIGVDGGQVMS